MRALLASTIVLALAASAYAGVFPERRRSQFQREEGHIVVPYLFSLPGIGSGYGVVGAVTNVNGSCTDLSATAFGGEVVGGAFGIDSVHLIPERLILDVGGAFLGAVAVRTYAERGMISDKEDYSIAEFENSFYTGSRLTLSFDDRRYEGYLGYYHGELQLRAMRDRHGVLILETTGSPRRGFDVHIAGVRADLTDDFMDPRRGIRADLSVWWSPKRDDGPEFYQSDLNLTGYLPVGRRSTLAFNYFHSDAHVLERGETDPAKIEASQGLDCDSLADPLQRNECGNFITNAVAENAHGSATALGGYGRLRSYPEGRFRGSHSRLLGSELRWNLTDENTPFNIYVVKDIRTAIQLAFFYEVGSVTDSAAGVWKTTRSSYGAGVRIVTASGVVYRIDLADGDEGFQPSIFFQYPWEL